MPADGPRRSVLREIATCLVALFVSRIASMGGDHIQTKTSVKDSGPDLAGGFQTRSKLVATADR